METRLTWDDAKCRINLAKHGLDFARASAVIESRYRLDVPVVRKGESRMLSISYVFRFKAVLTVIHTGRDGGATRIISFRRASTVEREMYYAWLENDE